MTPGRRSDAERNRRRVIETGVELLSADPETNMQAIADASGVGRSTVYRHFPTRDALLEAVLADVMVKARSRAGQAELVPGDPGRSIRNLSAALLDVGFAYGALIADREGESGAFETAKDSAESPTRAFLEAAVARGELRGDLPIEWMRTVTQTVTLSAIGEVRAGVISMPDAYELVAETLVAALVPAGRR